MGQYLQHIANPDGSFSVFGSGGQFLTRSAVAPQGSTLKESVNGPPVAISQPGFSFDPNGGGRSPQAIAPVDLRGPSAGPPVASVKPESPSQWSPAGQALYQQIAATGPQRMTPKEIEQYRIQTGQVRPPVVGAQKPAQEAGAVPTEGAVFAQPQPSGPIVTRGKAQWVNQSRNVQERELRPEDEKAIADAAEAQKSAIRDGAEAGSQKALEDFGAKMQYENDMARFNEMAQQREQAKHDRIDEQLGVVKKAASDAASGEIDRNRIWSNEGSRVTGAIGVLLGGLGTLNGGRNASLDIINKAMDDEIAAQRDALASKRNNVAAQNSIYGQLREQLGDQRLADQAYRSVLQQSLMNQLQTVSSRYDSEQIRANASKAIADLESQNAKTQADTHAKIVSGAQAWDNGVRVSGQAPVVTGDRNTNEAVARLEEIPGVANDKDVAGFGWWQRASRAVLGNKVTDLMTSEEGLENRSKATEAAAPILHSKGVSRVTPEMAKDYADNMSQRQLKRVYKNTKGRQELIEREQILNKLGNRATPQQVAAFQRSTGGQLVDVRDASED